MFGVMKYRRFGRTELPMPVISCGGMRYQYKWQDVPPAEVPRASQENLEAIIHRAVELGMNHLETARGYGSSEMQLGAVLPQLPRDKILVQRCPHSIRLLHPLDHNYYHMLREKLHWRETL